MAKSPKKRGMKKNAPPSPQETAPQQHAAKQSSSPSSLETAFLHYEAGDMVATRAQAKAFAEETPEDATAPPALLAKLWPSPSPSPSRQAIAQALSGHTRPPSSAYAYALVCLAVAAFLGLVVFLRS